jgi:hypothetical protein
MRAGFGGYVWMLQGLRNNGAEARDRPIPHDHDGPDVAAGARHFRWYVRRR